MRDLLIGFRSLRKAPVFAAVAILSLALAIGANSAIFSLIDGMLLRPLPGIRQPDRIAAIYSSSKREVSPLAAISWPDYSYYRQQNHVFSGLLAYLRLPFTVGEGNLENVSGELASDNYFDVLGVALQLGRGFVTGERGDVVVLSDRYWHDRFHADPDVLGKSVTLNGHRFEIVGVAAAGFHGVLLDWGARPELWVPIAAYHDGTSAFANLDLEHLWQVPLFMMNARLKDGVGLAQAAAEMDLLRHNIDSADPARAEQRKREAWEITVLPLTRFYPAFRERIVRMLIVLLAVVVGVLLVACTNIAALMLIRASQRQKETSLRIAVGAGIADLARLLLAESLWIGAAGCAGGLLFGSALIRLLLRFPKISVIPLASLDLTIDWRVSLFAASITGMVTFLFGLAPLRQSLKLDLIHGLRSRSSVGGTSSRGVLQMIQIGLTLALLAAAILFVRTFQNAESADPFLRSGTLLLAKVQTNSKSGSGTFFDQLVEQTRTLPGVQSAGAVRDLPLSGIRTDRESVSPVHGEAEGLSAHPQVNIVSPGYFQTVGAAIVSGRDFRSSDLEDTVIVNEELAKAFWHGDAVGQQIVRRNKTVTVAGVVHDPSRRSYREAVLPGLYLPVTRETQGSMSLVVRTAGAPVALIPAIRSIAESLSRDAVIDHVQTTAMYEDEVLAQEKITAWCLAMLAAFALLLSIVGLYGAMAYSISRRQSEIGIRMALGANRADVVGMVLAGAARIAVGGILIGSLASLAAIQYIRSMLYQVSASDPYVWSVVAAILSVSVLAAGTIPAWRAARIDPASALRSE